MIKTTLSMDIETCRTSKIDVPIIYSKHVPLYKCCQTYLVNIVFTKKCTACKNVRFFLLESDHENEIMLEK